MARPSDAAKSVPDLGFPRRSRRLHALSRTRPQRARRQAKRLWETLDGLVSSLPGSISILCRQPDLQPGDPHGFLPRSWSRQNAHRSDRAIASSLSTLRSDGCLFRGRPPIHLEVMLRDGGICSGRDRREPLRPDFAHRSFRDGSGFLLRRFRSRIHGLAQLLAAGSGTRPHPASRKTASTVRSLRFSACLRRRPAEPAFYRNRFQRRAP